MSSSGVRLTVLRAVGSRAISRSLLSNAARKHAAGKGNRELMRGRGTGMGCFARGTPAGEVSRGFPKAASARAFCAQADVPRVQEVEGASASVADESEAVNGSEDTAGDVAGDVAGNVAGDVTGTLAGDAIGDVDVGGGGAGDIVGDTPAKATERTAEEEQARLLERNRVEAAIEAKRRWLQEKLGMPGERALTVARNSKWMWDRDVETDFEPKMRWLGERIGIAHEQQVARLVAGNVFLLRISAEDLSSSMENLREFLGVSESTMNKMVADCPRILVVPVVEAARRMKWLEERLLLSGDNAMRVVVAQPVLLASSIESRLEPAVLWAERRLRLDPQQVGFLTLKYSKWMFAVARDGLEMRLRWLQAALGCSHEQAVRMMSRDGRLWFLGRKNLWPKILFFREDLGVPSESLREAVVKCPMILASNLNTRIVPRVARIREAGIPFDFEKHQRVVSVASDEGFEKWLAEALAARSAAETDPDP